MRFHGNEVGCPEPLPRAINVTTPAASIASSLRAETLCRTYAQGLARIDTRLLGHGILVGSSALFA